MKKLTELVHPSWKDILLPVEGVVAEIGVFLREQQKQGIGFLPGGKNILRAFQQPLDNIKVIIVGQDPYPTPGHPVGLSFSVAPNVHPLPKSLQNIFQEYVNDLGYEYPKNGDLSPWESRGVLLLNRVLTVAIGKPASHQGIGWEKVTDTALSGLAQFNSPKVAILWGKQAAQVKDKLADTPCITSAHPSPLSAHRGFFNSRPFSRANELLVSQHTEPVDWKLESK